MFDIEGVMRKELVDVGAGVKMSEPLKVEKRLTTGEFVFVSLSHQGILAICASPSHSIYLAQFTDLNINRQVEVNIKSITQLEFYDNVVLLLTREKPLREARVEVVFENPTLETFKEIGETNNVFPYTDVSLLHEKRVLYYLTMDDEQFLFNVDTRVNVEIDVGKKVHTIASL